MVGYQGEEVAAALKILTLMRTTLREIASQMSGLPREALCMFHCSNTNSGVYLCVKTCEVFLCFVTIMFVLSFALTSLFSFFYVTRKGDRFLHRG